MQSPPVWPGSTPPPCLVLCVDEKSQIQALNRTQPIRSVRPGLPEKATRDDKRNGTTTLFAALEVATGTVNDRCYDRHGKAGFLNFLKLVATACPRRELHEVFFGIITRQAIRRGSFDSVNRLVAAVRAFIDAYNDRCKPFVWTKTADEILPRATRQPTSDAGH